MRRRIALALAACLGLLPLLATQGDEKPDKKADPKPEVKKAEKAAKIEVPFKLTATNHVMVRAKLNGKGSFNLIMDTGAPTVFVTKATAKKAKAEPDEKKEGWLTFDSFELEGGLKIEKVRGRAEDLVQFEGMNSMGLAGVELHGIIGYTVLAKYRIEYDMTSNKLVFEPLAFDPPPLVPIGKDKDEKGTDIQTMGPMVKMMAAMLGIKPNFDLVPRGFTGIEFEEKDGKVYVKTVLAGSPAEKAGLKVGDHITSVKNVAIDSEKDLARALAKAGVGTKWKFSVTRGGKDMAIEVELGKGL
jgi:serine protease DegQ